MIKIVIVEDDQAVAEGLKYSIEYNKKYLVSEIYFSAEDALKNIGAVQPDLVLMDINLPGKSGIEAIPEVKKILPECDLLILTSSESESDIFEALRRGAAGYLKKDLSIEELLRALDKVRSGGSALSSNVAKVVIDSFRAPESGISLTVKEKSILEQFAGGMSHRKIAESNNISQSTVKFHTKNIYSKLNVSSKAEAVSKAIKLNLITV